MKSDIERLRKEETDNGDQGVLSNRFVILSGARNPTGEAMRFRGA
jgi:hypothetical protein